MLKGLYQWFTVVMLAGPHLHVSRALQRAVWILDDFDGGEVDTGTCLTLEEQGFGVVHFLCGS